MEIRLDELKKVEASSLPASPKKKGTDNVEAIIKVRKADYVPADIKVRAQIDPYMFTCATAVKKLQELEKDPQVESVSISKKLHVID